MSGKIKCGEFVIGRTEYQYCQLKRDGHFTRIICHSGDTTFLSSRPTDITDKLRWHRSYATAVNAPYGAMVCGELWIPGGTSEDVKKAINNQDPRLRFDAFALQSDPPEQSIGQTVYRLERMGFDTVETFIDPPYGFRSEPPKDVEGYVFKMSNTLGWYKWKPIRTADLIVTDFDIAVNGKHIGLLGSLRVETTCGRHMANVSGMNDETREQFSLNSANIIGKVIEVRYQRIGNNGKLVFPRFIRIRDDKTTEECPLSQFPELN